MGTEAKFQRVETFESHPSRYKHWQLRIDGDVAWLGMNIQEDNGLRPDDYQLKLNSYDLGVDIELRDAVMRLRFEHPEVRAVAITSVMPRIFCAGANIKMLASSTHAFKVNFCKYTNETRCFVEDTSAQAGQAYVAALNGTASGGGYELALACDEIFLIDDGSSAVSLPEVPLLGVLPGTGGLTRLVDKRKVRRDVADLFCTKAEGFRARDAEKLGLIDGSFSRSKWDDAMAEHLSELAAAHPGRATKGITLPALEVEVGDDHREYRYVSLRLDRESRVATLVVRAPDAPAPADAAALLAEGANTWSMRAFRELEDALCHLRFNEPEIGLVLLRTSGDPDLVLAHDAALHAAAGTWIGDELRFYKGFVLRQVDNTARSLFAIADQDSCFAGTLFELALAADRTYMLEDDDGAVTVRVTDASAGAYPMANGLTRLQARFLRTPEKVDEVLGLDEPLAAPDALDRGLVTLAPDEIDWEDEIRIAVEERVSLSPDALTGMEQNLRFVGGESPENKIFGRLSAWQNWIFQRPNAVGDHGALTLYGHPERPRFDWRRT